MDMISTARYGMMMAARTLDASAIQVSNIGADGSVDPVQAAIQVIEAKQSFKANVNVAKVADQMMEALLDIQMAPRT